MIVGIAGKKQSGKSTAAARLVDSGFEIISFSKTLKSMAAVLLRDIGLSSDELLAAEADKEAELPRIGVSYRRLLQSLGTDWGRCLNHRMWLLCAEGRLSSAASEHVVIDDVRFEDEAHFIRERGGVIVHLLRYSPNVDYHASEAGISILPGDIVISNNGSLDGLFDRLDLALNHKMGVL